MEPGADPTTRPPEWKPLERGQPISIPPVAFVFGATGYVGSALVTELGRDPRVAKIVAHARPGSGAADALTQRLASIRTDTELDRTEVEGAALESRLAELKPTHVFLCHGTTSKRAKGEGLSDPYEAVDVGLTRLLCSASAPLDPAPRIVYLSSMGASARARGAYLKARWRAEDAVRKSGLPFTICRAPLLTGPDRPERRPAEIWGARIANPALRVLGAVGFGRLRDRYTSMDAVEAAEGLVRSAFHYMTINRVVQSDELRKVGVYERERWTPESRRDQDRH